MIIFCTSSSSSCSSSSFASILINWGFITHCFTLRSVAKIHLGQMECFELGNLDSLRDWGHAKDYVEGMWMMLQQESPDDFVLATGEMHSVRWKTWFWIENGKHWKFNFREFVESAFRFIGMEIKWEGSGDNEVGREKSTGVVRVRVNPKFYRPTEVEQLLGDPTKAKTRLGWSPKVNVGKLEKE